MNAKIYNNKITNARYGIRMSLGSAGNRIYDNTFDKISEWGLYTYEGSDAPLVSNGRPSYNIFENNDITNAPKGVKFKYSDNLSVIGKFVAVRKVRNTEEYVGRGHTAHKQTNES